MYGETDRRADTQIDSRGKTGRQIDMTGMDRQMEMTDR